MVSFNPLNVVSFNPLNVVSFNPLNVVSFNPLNAVSFNPLNAIGFNPLNSIDSFCWLSPVRLSSIAKRYNSIVLMLCKSLSLQTC